MKTPSPSKSPMPDIAIEDAQRLSLTTDLSSTANEIALLHLPTIEEASIIIDLPLNPDERLRLYGLLHQQKTKGMLDIGRTVSAQNCLDGLSSQLQTILQQYLISGGISTFIASFLLMVSDGRVSARRVVKEMLAFALGLGVAIDIDECGERQRESISKLISSLYLRGYVSTRDVCDGVSLMVTEGEDGGGLATLAISPYGAEAIDGLAAITAQLIFDSVMPDSALITLEEQFPHLSTELLARIQAHFLAPLPMEQMKLRIKGIAEELFSSGDITEALTLIHDLHATHFHSDVIKRLLILSLDSGAREKELASVLMEHLIEGKLMDVDYVIDGFLRLFLSIDDVVLDSGVCCLPDIATFVVRAMCDGALPMSFIDTNIPPFIAQMPYVQQVTQQCVPALKSDHYRSSVRTCWGPAAGLSLADLQQKITMFVTELFVSKDREGFTSQVREMNEPYFLHYVVSKALRLVMDFGDDEMNLLCHTVHGMIQSRALLSTQLVIGVTKLVDAIDDISLDVPHCRNILRMFVSRANSEGWISHDICDTLLQDLAYHS